MTVVNHWGVWVDSETPVTGVISMNSVESEWLFDNEICPTCEELIDELNNLEYCPICGDVHLDEDGFCPACGYDKEKDMDFVECFDHEKLVGDWIKDDEGYYIPDETGEFAGIVSSSSFNCIQVIWSKHTKKGFALCSPCFPGQADLDSEGEFTAFILPEDLMRKDN